jgi:hypothetical protein
MCWAQFAKVPGDGYHGMQWDIYIYNNNTFGYNQWDMIWGWTETFCTIFGVDEDPWPVAMLL